MGINSNYLSSDGFALRISCRKKKFVKDLQGPCIGCDRFVCKECATYRRQGPIYGWMCKACKEKMK